jgi:Derlin-2/3
MAQALQGGDGGMMGGFPLEQWFYEMPVCTRWWMTAALSASVLVQCHIISPFQLFYSVRAVFFRSQVRILHACSVHKHTPDWHGDSIGAS